ncbi:MAG: pirin family protein [Desulfobacteraceae bacterium]|nr:pirin family protein [Desulfobacteraceae bacterium]
MTVIRKIRKALNGKPTMEGAGVLLNRVFGFSEVPEFDPFLLLDDFGSDNPDHYIKGFPWHPHRGIETITYVLEGDVEHADNLGNKGLIGSGDVQWMTAGSGIIHQEMPKGDGSGKMSGIQLWANLPSGDKMMPPRYRDVAADRIPEADCTNGVTAKVICGEMSGVKGPVQDIVIDPEYFDVAVPPHTEFRHPTKPGYTVFIYMMDGRGYVNEGNGGSTSGKQPDPGVGSGTIVLFDDGDEIRITASGENARFLLVAGKPIGEPVAWQGPVVMNTREELEVAFAEYRKGTFIKT